MLLWSAAVVLHQSCDACRVLHLTKGYRLRALPVTAVLGLSNRLRIGFGGRSHFGRCNRSLCSEGHSSICPVQLEQYLSRDPLHRLQGHIATAAFSRQHSGHVLLRAPGVVPLDTTFHIDSTGTGSSRPGPAQHKRHSLLQMLT